MALEEISLDALTVNRSNDRHGDLANESEAIAWLIENHSLHMKNLAKDIVATGCLFENPLVRPRGKKYVIYDGNRRTTCLKLLDDPTLAPTAEFRTFFEEQRSLWVGKFPRVVECQVERDSDHIDEILYRRHTGSQAGVGQSHWDDTAKDNFVARTGKRLGANIAEDIERKLVDLGMIHDVGVLPRTNLKRLLSSDEFRKQVGLSLKKGQLYFTHKPEAALKALRKIADDLTAKRIVQGDLWDNDSKRRYLNELLQAGELPSPNSLLKEPIPFVTGPSKRTLDQKMKLATKRPSVDLRRTTLIPSDLTYKVKWTGETARQREFWNELQNRLVLHRHINAISVSFRVLLELSVDHYIEAADVESHPNDHLSKKVEKSALRLESVGAIDEKYRKDLQKFAHSESIVSTNTMHRYVHSSDVYPSPAHLTALWDTLSRFLVCCLNAGSMRHKKAA